MISAIAPLRLIGNVGGMVETTWLDATAQAELVRRGEVSPKELVEAAIAAIEAVNPQLDAVIRTRFDAGARRGRGRPARRPVPRRADPVQGPGLHGRGRADGVRPRAAARRGMAGDVLPRGAVPGGRLHPARPDQRAGAGHHGDHRAAQLPRRRATRGIPATPPAAPRAGRPPRWPAAWWRSRTPTTAAAPSASRPASAAWSGSSRPAARVSQGPLIGEAWAGGTIDGARHADRPRRGRRARRDQRRACRASRTTRRRCRARWRRRSAPTRAGCASACSTARARRATSTTRSAGRRWPARRGCWSRSATTSSSPRPRPCSSRSSSGHFITIIAADTEATFQAFEMLLGRPIGEDEIEPRNAAYRRAGQALNAVAVPAEPGVARDVGAADGGLVDRP